MYSRNSSNHIIYAITYLKEKFKEKLKNHTITAHVI